MRLRKHLGWLCVAVTWGVFVFPLLTSSGNTYLGDTGFMDAPLRVYAGKMIRSGRFPVWTDALAGGIPMFSESETGMAYPLFWLFVLFPSPKTNDVFVALHYAVWGLGLYLLARQAGAGRLGSGVAASIYMTCWGMRAMHCSPPALAGFAWLPVSLWLVGQCRVGWNGSPWLASVATCFVILPGIPYLAMSTIPPCVAYWLYLNWRQSWKTKLQGAGIVSLLPVLLAMVQLAPLLNYYRVSNRRELSTHDLAASNGVPWSLLAPWGFGQPDGRSVEEPERSQWPAQAAYACGGLALVVGLSSGRRMNCRWFWLGAATVCLMASMQSPFLWFVYIIPPFSFSRMPGYHFLGAVCVGSLFTAYGFTSLAASINRRLPAAKSLLPVAAASLLGVIWIATDMRPFLSDGPFYTELNSQLADDLAAWKRERGHIRIFAPQSQASLGRADANWSESDWRRNAARLAVDYNLIHDIPSIDQCDLLEGTVVNSRLYWFGQLLQQRNPNAFKAAAVTHLSLDRNDPPDGYNRIDAGGGRFFRSGEDRPPAWMVYNVELAAEREARCARLAQAEFDPYRTALVETSNLALDPIPAVPPTVRMLPNIVGRKEFQVQTASRGLLVVSNTFYPELQAFVDGVRATVLPVNQAFCGVLLSPGEHHVVLSYSPREIYFGLAISVCAWTLVLWRIVHHARLGAVLVRPT